MGLQAHVDTPTAWFGVSASGWGGDNKINRMICLEVGATSQGGPQTWTDGGTQNRERIILFSAVAVVTHFQPGISGADLNSVLTCDHVGPTQLVISMPQTHTSRSSQELLPLTSGQRNVNVKWSGPALTVTMTTAAGPTSEDQSVEEG